MSQNSKELKVKYHKGEKPSKKFNNKNPRPGNSGQWTNPGVPTEISSRNITMKDVPYPVRGVDNLGNEMIMMPGAEYTFPGSVVTEYPMMKAKKGGWLEKYQTRGSVKYVSDPNDPALKAFQDSSSLYNAAKKAFEFEINRQLNEDTERWERFQASPHFSPEEKARWPKPKRSDYWTVESARKSFRAEGSDFSRAQLKREKNPLDGTTNTFLYRDTTDPYDVGTWVDYNNPGSTLAVYARNFNNPIKPTHVVWGEGVQDVLYKEPVLKVKYDPSRAPMSPLPMKEWTYEREQPALQTDRPVPEPLPFVDHEAFQYFSSAGELMIDTDRTSPTYRQTIRVPKGYIPGSKEEKEYRSKHTKKTGGPLPTAQAGVKEKYTQPINPVTGKPFPPQGIEVSPSPLDLIGAGSVVGLLRGAGALATNLVNRAHPADRGWMNNFANWAVIDIANTSRQTYEDARDLYNQEMMKVNMLEKSQKTKREGGPLPTHQVSPGETGISNYLYPERDPNALQDIKDKWEWNREKKKLVKDYRTGALNEDAVEWEGYKIPLFKDQSVKRIVPPDYNLIGDQLPIPVGLMKTGGSNNWLQKYQTKGSVKPFVTSNLSEYNKRKTAYADSLNLYNRFKNNKADYYNFIKSQGFDPSRIEEWATDGYVNTDVHPRIGATSYGILTNSGGGYNRDAAGNPIDYTTYPTISNTGVRGFRNVPDNSELNKKMRQFSGQTSSGYAIYKKPVQEVILSRPDMKPMTPIGFSQYEPQLQQREGVTPQMLSGIEETIWMPSGVQISKKDFIKQYGQAAWDKATNKKQMGGLTKAQYGLIGPEEEQKPGVARVMAADEEGTPILRPTTGYYLPEVEISAAAPDTYNNYIRNKYKDAGLGATMFGLPIDYAFGFPQAAMTKAFTGKYQLPSEAMGIENPVGALLTDVVLDPTNLAGAGLLTKEKALAALASSKESGMLSNAWRLNPMAYQYNLPRNTMWRGLGQEGMEDAVSSGLFRSKQNVVPEYVNNFNLSKDFGINPYFTPKFNTAATYGDDFIAEVPRSAANWRNRYGKRHTWSQVADRPIPIEEGRLLQKDWLRGYKEVPKKEDGGSKLPPHLPEAYKTGGWLDNYQDGGANTATASTQQQERPTGTYVESMCGPDYVETTDENGNPVCVSPEEWQRRLKPFNDASQAKLEEARKNDPNPSGNPKASWNPAIDGPYPKIRGYNEPLESNFSSYCIDCDENDSRSMRGYMRSQRRLQRKQEREMRRFERQNSPGFFEKFKDMDFEAPRLGIGRFFKDAWKGIKDACTPGEDCPSFEEGGQWLEKYQTPPGEFVYKGNNYILKNDESTNYVPKFYAVKYGPGPSLPSYIEAAPKFQQELQSFYNNQRFTPQPPKNISTGTQKNENLLDIQKTLNKANASVAARSSTNVTLRDPEAESQAAMAKAQEEAQERRGYIRQGVSEEEKFAQAQRRATGAAFGLSPEASDVGYQQAMYIPQAIGTGVLATYGALPALNWFNNTLVGQGLGAYGAVQGVTSIPGHLQEFDEKPATTIGNLTLDAGLGVLGYKYGFKPLFNRGRNTYNAVNTRWNRYLFGDDIINTSTINTPTALPGSSNNIISTEGYVPGSSLRNSIFTKSNKNWLDKYE